MCGTPPAKDAGEERLRAKIHDELAARRAPTHCCAVVIFRPVCVSKGAARFCRWVRPRRLRYFLILSTFFCCWFRPGWEIGTYPFVFHAVSAAVGWPGFGFLPFSRH